MLAKFIGTRKSQLPRIRIKYRTSYYSTADLTTYSVTRDIGSGFTGRKLVVAFSARNATTLSFTSLKVNGVAYTPQITHKFSGYGDMGFAVIAFDNTDTNATVEVTYSAAGTHGVIALWVVDGLDNTALFDSATASAVDPVPLNVNTAADGAIFSLISYYDYTISNWTGIDEFGGSFYHTCADKEVSTGEIPRAVSCDVASTTQVGGICISLART